MNAEALRKKAHGSKLTWKEGQVWVYQVLKHWRFVRMLKDLREMNQS